MKKNHSDYLNSCSDDDPLSATLIYPLFLQAFGTNNRPKYPPKNCEMKHFNSNVNSNGKKQKLSAKEHERSIVLQQFHNKKNLQFVILVTELNLSQMISPHRCEGKTSVQQQPDWLLSFSYHTREPRPGLPACCASSSQDNHVQQPEPNPPFNELTSIGLGDLYKTESTFKDFAFSGRVWWTEGADTEYWRSCEDTNYDKWRRLGIWDVRVPEGTHRQGWVSGWPWMGTEAFWTQTRPVPGANFIYQDQKLLDVFQKLGGWRKKNLKLNLTTDGGKQNPTRLRRLPN